MCFYIFGWAQWVYLDEYVYHICRKCAQPSTGALHQKCREESHILFFSMLVASFCGLYCSITDLHVYQCQPTSFMNTQEFYFSFHVNPYPGVSHIFFIFMSGKLLVNKTDLQALYLCRTYCQRTGTKHLEK